MIPRVLFVCVRNAGKSRMAAALMTRAAGGAVAVASAGTRASGTVNALSAQALQEVGADIGDHAPRQLTEDDLRWADRVVVLGAEARVAAPDGTPVEVWSTDEPSERGIDGLARMRLVRDDIDARVRRLAAEFTGS